MITIRSGFLLTPIRMTLNDIERPIHLKVAITQQRIIRSTSCLILEWGFCRRTALFLVRSNPRWRPAAILKISNGQISATHYPLHFMYVHRLLCLICPQTL